MRREWTDDFEVGITPCGELPPRLRVLFITSTQRTGRWLADSFAADRATHVILEEATGIVAGLARLRDDAFDTVLVGHDPDELDALEVLDAIRAGSCQHQPILVLGHVNPAEIEALCLESGADAYLCLNTTTTRSLIWHAARATERKRLIDENHQFNQAKRHREKLDRSEAKRIIDQQKRLSTTDHAEPGHEMGLCEQLGLGDAWTPPEQLVNHYREMLQTYVIMGTGNLDAELKRLSAILVTAGIGARQFMTIHLQAVERMVADLGAAAPGTFSIVPTCWRSRYS